MTSLMKLFLFGSTAAFMLAACTASVTNPVEQASEVTSTPDEQRVLPTNTEVNQDEATEPVAPTPTPRDFRIITLLPRDAIPAIDNPQYYTVGKADAEYDDEEQVLGVFFEGEARAYSVAKLSRHEIVNDTVGGQAISVTW